MATELKLRRGSSAQHAAFTGADGEATVDTTKHTLVIHDGATPGGHPLLPESAVGVTVQGYDDVLTAIAGLTSAADKALYFTGPDAPALMTVTSAARSLLDDTTVAAMRATLDAQQLDTELTAIAGLASSADKAPYFTGPGAAALMTVTAQARALLDDATAADQAATVGAGVTGLTEDATPDSANDYVMTYDASASAAKKVKLANIGAGLPAQTGNAGKFLTTNGTVASWAIAGGFEKFAEYEPTSDVSSVVFTGLSVFDEVIVEVLFQPTSFAWISVDGRVSGGTWRSGMLVTGSFATNNAAARLHCSVKNFNSASAPKLAQAEYSQASAAVDRSSATATLSAATIQGYASYAETWDELRLSLSSGNFEGSTADARAYFVVYGRRI